MTQLRTPAFTRLLRGGRMTKWKGQAASCAPVAGIFDSSVNHGTHYLLRGGRHVKRLGKEVSSYASMALILAVAIDLSGRLSGGNPSAVFGFALADSINLPADLQINLAIPADPPTNLRQTIVGAGSITDRVTYIFGGDYSTPGPISPNVHFEDGFTGQVTLNDERSGVERLPGANDPRFISLRNSGSVPVMAPYSVFGIVGGNILFDEEFSGRLNLQGRNGIYGLASIIEYSDGPIGEGSRTVYGEINFSGGFSGQIEMKGSVSESFLTTPWNRVERYPLFDNGYIFGMRAGTIVLGKENDIGDVFSGKIVIESQSSATGISAAWTSVDEYIQFPNPNWTRTSLTRTPGEMRVNGSFAGSFDIASPAHSTAIEAGILNVAGDFLPDMKFSILSAMEGEWGAEATAIRLGSFENEDFVSTILGNVTPNISVTGVGDGSAWQVMALDVGQDFGGIYSVDVTQGVNVGAFDRLNVGGDFHPQVVASGSSVSGFDINFLTIGNSFLASSVTHSFFDGDNASSAGYSFRAGEFSVAGDFGGFLSDTGLSEEYTNNWNHGFLSGSGTIGGNFSAHVSAVRTGPGGTAYGWRGNNVEIDGDFVGSVRGTLNAGFVAAQVAFPRAYAWGWDARDVFIEGDFSPEGLISARTTGSVLAAAYGLDARDVVINGNFAGQIEAITSSLAEFEGAYGVTATSMLVGGQFSGSVRAEAAINDAYGVRVRGGLFSVGGGVSGDISATVQVAGGGDATAVYVGTLDVAADIVGSIVATSMDGDATAIWANDMVLGTGVISGEIAGRTTHGEEAYGISVDGGMITRTGGAEGNLITLASGGLIEARASTDTSGGRAPMAVAIDVDGDLNLKIEDGAAIRATAGYEAYGIAAVGGGSFDLDNAGAIIVGGGGYAPGVAVYDLRNPASDAGARVDITNSGMMTGTYTIDVAFADSRTGPSRNTFSLVNSGTISSDDDPAEGLDYDGDAVSVYSWGDTTNGNVLASVDATIENSGTISAAWDAVYFAPFAGGTHMIRNLAGGFIRGDSDEDGGGAAIRDVGDESAGPGLFRDSDTIVENAGSIIGDVDLGGGSDRLELINGGTLDGSLLLGSGLDVFALRAGDGIVGARFAFLGADGEIDLGAMGIELVEKLGVGAYELSVSDGSGLLVNALEVREGRLVLSSATRVNEEASADAASLLGADNGGVVVSDAVSGIETALEVQQGFRAEAISLGAGSGFYNFATDAGSRVVLVDGAGTELPGATITGGAGTQRIFNRAVLDADGRVQHEARIVNAISLGEGDDRVTSNYGVFERAIDLGAGNDVFEIFMTPDGDEGAPGTLFGGSFVSVDGGDGDDTLMLSLRSGTRVLMANPLEDPAFESTLTRLERLAKGGAGTVVFDFNASGAGAPQQVLVEGPAVFAQNTETVTLTLSQIDDADAVAENIVSSVTLRGTDTAVTANSFEFEGRGDLSVESGAVLTVASTVSEVRRSGSQRIAIADGGALSATGGVSLGAGDDEVRVADGATISGRLDGGADTDMLVVSRSQGAAIGDAATGGASDVEVVADSFEMIALNSGVAGARLNVEGVLGAGGGEITLGLGELNLNDADESTGWSPETWDRLRAGTFTVGAGGILTGNGLLEVGETSIFGVLRPGNSIGTLQSTGNYVLNAGSRYELEYRVPNDLTNFSGDGALVGKNTVFDIASFAACPGAGCATSVGDTGEQDADLIAAAGTILLNGTVDLVIDPASGDTAADFAAALALPGNTAGEIRYLVARAEGGIQSRPIGLGDISYRYLDDAGNAVASGAYSNLVLVLSGTGPSRSLNTPVTSSSSLLRPEELRPDGETGCLPGQVLLFNGEDEDGTACVWFDVSGTRGSDFDLGNGVSESLSEVEYTLGYERAVDWVSGGQTRIGLVAGYRTTSLDQSNGSSLDDEAVRLGVYADMRMGPTDLSFSAVHGWHDVTQSRLDSVGDRLTGDYDAESLALNIEATRWFYVDPCWDVGPTAGLNWTRVSRDGYTERADGGSGLERFQYDAATADGLWGFLGASARYRAGATGTPTDFTGTIGVENLLSGGDFPVSGVYLADATATTQTGSTLSRFGDDAIRAKFDVTTQLSKLTALSAGIGGRFAEGGQDYSASLNLRMEW